MKEGSRNSFDIKGKATSVLAAAGTIFLVFSPIFSGPLDRLNGENSKTKPLLQVSLPTESSVPNDPRKGSFRIK